MQPPSTRYTQGASLARGLGWFSVGLGVAEIAAPGSVARLIGARGTDRTRKTMRALGAREVVQGVAILSRPRRPGPLWARVAGDAIDLALLGLAMRGTRTRGNRIAATIATLAGVMVLDALAAKHLARARSPIELSITIARLPGEVYASWCMCEDGDVGNVTFTLAADRRSTDVHVELPPAGPVASTLARLFGHPRPTQTALREFKQRVESGELNI
jgi:hypothetical protein